MKRKNVHSAAYSTRIEAVEALREHAPQAGPDVARLRDTAGKLRAASNLFGRAASAASYEALADLFEMVALLSEWQLAVLNASIDPPRFLAAAKARATAWLSDEKSSTVAQGLRDVALAIGEVQAITEVPGIADKLSAVPLPIGVFDAAPSTLRVPELTEEDDRAIARPTELAVAFVKFTINGTPLDEIHYVAPGQTHDMDVEVRVSRWPKGATHLLLEPVTIEPPDTYQIQAFSIEAPTGEDGPFRLHGKGRILLKVPNSLQARPYQFKYAARFLPAGSEQPVTVIGDREVKLEGADLAQHSLSGYRHIDKKLVEIRDMLRATRHVDQGELRDSLTIAVALGNLASRTVQGNLFRERIAETEFHTQMRELLRQRPEIGGELEEHPHMGGGITDLSFRGIPIELKAEKDTRLAPDDCKQFVNQTASYAVGAGRHIGLLCVLDSSPKDEPAFPAENGILVFSVGQADGTPVYVIAVLLQGNLAKPSSFS